MSLKRVVTWFKHVWNLKQLLELNETQAALLQEQSRRLVQRKRSLLHCESRISQQRLALSKLLEPKPTVTCGKIRLRDREEADAFARHIEAETLHTGRVIRCKPVKCKVCPRHPFTGLKFWHIVTDRSPQERAANPSDRKGRARRVAEDQQVLAQRRRNAFAASQGDKVVPLVKPSDLAKLKNKFNRPEEVDP